MADDAWHAAHNMSLAITVGVLADLLQDDPEGAAWFQQQFEIVNRLLADNDLPPHAEPDAVVVSHAERSLGSFPYSFLHCLRRFAARCKIDGHAPPPLKAGDAPERDLAIEEASSLFDFHLLVHSDAEGFYVPIDFENVLVDADDLGLAGALLGSSIRLLRELIAVAPALQIALRGDTLPVEEQRRIEQQVAAEADPFWRERLCWLTLFHAAHASTRYGVAIVFQ